MEMQFLNLFFWLIICGVVMMSQGLRIKRSDNQTQTTEMHFNTTQPVAQVKATTSPATVNASKEHATTANLELTESAHVPRAKRRLALMNEVLMPRHRRHHATGTAAPIPSAALPPYVYFNKMISPDGKQQVKEFEILAPNMMIESVEKELSYGPELVVPQDLEEVLLLDNSPPPAPVPSKHHHKHKVVLPSMGYLMQQMMKLNQDKPFLPKKELHSNHRDTPLYKFLDSSVDLFLRNNHETIKHLLDLEPDNELDIKKMDKKKSVKPNAIKEISTKDDELLVSCPIHHEHHANKNGEDVENDVVLVDECHIV